MERAQRVVKVSAACARLPFNGCEPEYIRSVCHARCCESSTAANGTLITIHPWEEAAIRARGGQIIGGLLQPRPGERRCPFKTSEQLCCLHRTPDKPFGCIASPFTLNRRDTLIVRNRYKLLKCFRDGRRLPAYRAFSASLVLLFGADTASAISRHLDAGGGDRSWPMPERSYTLLKENDRIKHQALSG
jgi:hypothetical protein